MDGVRTAGRAQGVAGRARGVAGAAVVVGLLALAAEAPPLVASWTVDDGCTRELMAIAGFPLLVIAAVLTVACASLGVAGRRSPRAVVALLLVVLAVVGAVALVSAAQSIGDPTTGWCALWGPGD